MRLEALLAAALLFAGCTAAAGYTGIEMADRAGAQTPAGSQLLMVAAFEAKSPTELLSEMDGAERAPPEEVQRFIRAMLGEADDAPGDGYAPRWAFVYAHQTEVFALVVDASGKVKERIVFPPDATQSMPPAIDLSALTIDSPEAARIVRLNLSTFDTIVAAGDAFANIGLVTGMHSGQPRVSWTVMVASKSLGLSAMAEVDAVTGAVLRSYESGKAVQPPTTTTTTTASNPSPPPPTEPSKQEAGTTTGSVNVVQASHEFTFELKDGTHAKLKVVAESKDLLPGGIRYTVTSPNGNPMSASAQTGGMGESLYSRPEAGTYRVHIQLDQGVRQDYAFHWCTDGVPQGETNPAC